MSFNNNQFKYNSKEITNLIFIIEKRINLKFYPNPNRLNFNYHQLSHVFFFSLFTSSNNNV
jgi:hypothetical protein